MNILICVFRVVSKDGVGESIETLRSSEILNLHSRHFPSEVGLDLLNMLDFVISRFPIDDSFI
jgi:hypothetical protein